MKRLTLHYTGRNRFPITGVFVPGATLSHWLKALQQMELSVTEVLAYPVPGQEAGSFFGCILLPETRPNDPGPYMECQLVAEKLFIPTHTDVSPTLAHDEWNSRLPGGYCFFHPENGLSVLGTPLDWAAVWSFDPPTTAAVRSPAKPIRVPQRITVVAMEIEAEKLDNPFTKRAETEKRAAQMEALQLANDRAIARFLEQLQANPEAALAVAIPVDQMGTSRGSRTGSFSTGGSGWGEGLPLILIIFLVIAGIIVVAALLIGTGGTAAPIVGFLVLLARLLGSGSSSGRKKAAGNNVAVASNNKVYELLRTYRQLAEQYDAKGEYDKAAHIYQKLLKDDVAAAQSLEKGRRFAEAAHLYEKKGDKKAAIRCFEKARMYRAAGKLYGELQQFESAGDMFANAGNHEQARKWYEKAAQDHIEAQRYLQAAQLFERKMQAPVQARDLLMKGWEEGIQGIDCLVHYFSSFENPALLASETRRMYVTTCNTSRKTFDFLRVLRTLYAADAADHDVNKLRKELAYEIVSTIGNSNPSALNELRAFNPHDARFPTETLWYRLSHKK